MKKILIIEDRSEVANVLKIQIEQLSNSQIDVEIVSTGNEGIDRIIKNPNAYSIVIIDYELTDINGLQVAERIRMEFKNSPSLILCTGHDASEIVQNERNMFDFYIQKPFTMEQIQHMLQIYYKPN